MRIIEIIGRSEQGITRPFHCRGDDDEFYYVKGRFAGYHSLCCEIVAGELARGFELPVAPFAVVEVPKKLIMGSLREDINDLGDGLAFGSRIVSGASELRWNEVASNKIDEDLRSRVLVFDWWVANGDRMLSEIGGNPNLLWSPSNQQLTIIDHNLAFSPDVTSHTIPEFGASHVFGAELLERELAFWSNDLSNAPIMKAWIELSSFWQENPDMLDNIWDELPEEWTEAASQFDLSEVRSLLNRIEGDDVWGILNAESNE